MTREIKFRFWDKKENKWLLGYELPSLGGFSMIGEVMMMGEYASLLSSYFPDRLEDIVLMQFTGLKDKNGKEIYEGDIVNDLITGRVGIVKFNHGAFVITYKEISNWKPVNRGGAVSVEVVGNIYENPELLNHETTN